MRTLGMSGSGDLQRQGGAVVLLLPREIAWEIEPRLDRQHFENAPGGCRFVSFAFRLPPQPVETERRDELGG